MFLVTANKPKQLLYLHFIQNVGCTEIERGRAEIEEALRDFQPGFHLVTDLSPLARFDLKCSGQIGKTMELLEQRGLGLVVRVIPNPAKDFGLNILSLFHYRHPIRTVTCENLAEAEEILS